MNCYLSRNYKGTEGAGNKAKTDIEKIMAGMGYRNVGMPMSVSSNTVIHFIKTLLGVIMSPFGLRKGDILVLQYPLKKYFSLVCRMAHARGAKVITVIHDLGSFRRKALTEEHEIRRLSHSDYIIAHNDSMKKWLESRGCRVRIGTLKIFDYLSDTCNNSTCSHESPYTVVYAGGLSRRKNNFLYEWGDYIHTYKVRIYGHGFEPAEAKGSDKFDVMGFVKSDELIATARGDFGLVWDGASVDECNGNWGEYLKINAPHKTSLYLRCGLPVIVWTEAAMAPFVRDNGIGLCVKSLKEVDGIMSAMTRDEYERMRANAIRIGRQIGEGHYITTALEEADKYLGLN